MGFSPNHVLEKDHLIKIEKCDLHKESSFEDILNYNKSQETLQPIEPSEIELRLDALEAIIVGEDKTSSLWQNFKAKLGLSQ